MSTTGRRTNGLYSLLVLTMFRIVVLHVERLAEFERGIDVNDIAKAANVKRGTIIWSKTLLRHCWLSFASCRSSLREALESEPQERMLSVWKV